MNAYKLDEHLKYLCDQHKRYENLYSTWTLNKKTCSELLKDVVIQYPHFSMHDASHAEAVIAKMEMLLGERVQTLSPTDTWLLLHAAYAHDLGMVVQWKDIEARWKDENFQDELARLETLQDEDLRKAVQFVRSAHDLKVENTWPLQASKYVRLINAALFRGRHAQMSQEYIKPPAGEFGLDLGHNGMIQSRLVKLLGQICMLHTAPLKRVLALDDMTDGYGSDHAHPRFVAMMLRLGDLLDIDNGRFNTGAIAVAGGLPETSQPHYAKHEATTHLLVTPQEIRFRSDCPDNAAYLEARTFVSWLEQEVNFLTIHWARIVPEDLGGYAPRFDDKELLIRGVPDIEGVAGLRLTISQEKAFQLIEGANIYNDPLVFLREVLQNAMDAAKLQLWSDLCSDAYLAWMGPMDEARRQALQPYDIKSEIYQNYPIHIKVSAIDTNRVRIKITDRGTGISVESFKRMCNVGESNAGSDRLRAILRKMPNWLRPTAGFGIGLQSIFLVADQFTIDTSTGQDAYHAVVYSRRKGGYLQLTRSAHPMRRGTTITIETDKLNHLIPDERQAAYSSASALRFDPMLGQNQVGETYILSKIDSLCKGSFFPIHVECRDKSVDQDMPVSSLPAIGTEGWELWQNRYWYKPTADSSQFSLWDTREAVLEKIDFDKRNYWQKPLLRQYHIRFQFKGMPVENVPFFIAYCMVDVYGLDAKETISLNRSEFTSEGKRRIRELHQQDQTTLCNIILQKFQDKQFNPDKAFEPGGAFENFNLYAFWQACTPQQRQHIPKTVVARIPDAVDVLVNTDSNKYQTAKKEIRDLLPRIETYTYIIQFSWVKRSVGWHDIICPIAADPPECLIADKTFFNILCTSYYIKSLRLVQIELDGVTRSLVFITWQDAPWPIQVSDAARKAVLLSLREDPLVLFDYGLTQSTRRATFAIEGYEAIAVRSLPDLISKPIDVNSAWTISPFTEEDDNNRKGKSWSKEQFTAEVVNSRPFSLVVDWVECHSLRETPPTRQEIIEAYQKLIGEYYDVAVEEDAKSEENN